MTVVPEPATLSAAHAARIAREAAAVAGLPYDGLEMLRLGSNAIFRLGEAVIRVARGLSGPEVAAREVQVANALIAAGVPCVPPWPVSQPLMIDGHPVTFWFEIPAPLEQPSMAEFGAIIRQLHGVGGDLGLPPLDPWERTPERVEQAPVREQDRRVLRAVLAEVQDRWGNAEFQLAPGVIHGDAHAGNVVRGSDGATVLIDFESACVGPREWDLAPMGLYVTTLGWISRRQYTTFVDAYGGFDVTTAPAFDLLQRMRELRMTAWLAMHSTESAETAAEVEHRVACLADPGLPRHWSAR